MILRTPPSGSFQHRAVKQPRSSPVRRPVGPAPRPPDYSGTAAGNRSRVDIEQCYTELTRLLDLELVDVCQIPNSEFRRYLGRERPDRDRWVYLTTDSTGPAPKGSAESRHILWLADRAREVWTLRKEPQH